jgi:hypothetical protein
VDPSLKEKKEEKNILTPRFFPWAEILQRFEVEFTVQIEGISRWIM